MTRHKDMLRVDWRGRHWEQGRADETDTGVTVTAGWGKTLRSGAGVEGKMSWEGVQEYRTEIKQIENQNPENTILSIQPRMSKYTRIQTQVHNIIS